MSSEKKKTPIQISTDLLDFDTENPRLFGEELDQNPNITMFIEALNNVSDLQELIFSILENGYLDIEPMVVIKKSDGRFTVLEGNRRLAAIRIIQQNAKGEKVIIPIKEKISDDVLSSITSVSIYIVDNRDEARAFIGFKHVNGAHRWDSYAKANYVTNWYLKGDSIEKIADSLGDRNLVIQSMVGAMLVLRQAEKENIFNREWRTKSGKFGFSHLYTALNRSTYAQYLELESGWNEKPKKSPIKSENYKKLEIVMSYIYGNKQSKIESVINSQNPDLKYLGEVLLNDIAFATLEETNDLNQAHEFVIPTNEVILKALIKLKASLDDSIRVITRYKTPDIRIKEYYDTLRKTFEILDDTMEEVHDK